MFVRPAPDAYGVAFNANYRAGENLMWFLRAGIGTGSNFGTGALAGGIGWRPPNAQRDLFGVAIGWTNPAPPSSITIPIPIPLPQFRSQYTGETFYRIAISPNFMITPDYQLLVNPSFSPRQDYLQVYSVRFRVTI
jgi:porin